MVTAQVREVPVQPPDHAANVELAFGAAVKDTTVPGLKEVPEGFVETDPLPVPVLVIVKVYCGTPAWVAVKVFPAMTKEAVLEELVVFAKTEKFMVVVPLPLLLEVKTSQDELEVAVHVQPV